MNRVVRIQDSTIKGLITSLYRADKISQNERDKCLSFTDTNWVIDELTTLGLDVKYKHYGNFYVIDFDLYGNQRTPSPTGLNSIW